MFWYKEKQDQHEFI